MDGNGKYAIIRMDKLKAVVDHNGSIREAIALLVQAGLVENPSKGNPEEFFLIKLKDRNAPEALLAYSKTVFRRDAELGVEVYALSLRSGVNHPQCKDPD